MSAALVLSPAASEMPFPESARRRASAIVQIRTARRNDSPQESSARQVGTPARRGIGPQMNASAKSTAVESVARFSEQGLRLAAWMKAAQGGDRGAYENLIRASIPFIKMVARKQGVPPDLMDDVVQETLLTVHRIRQTYDSIRPFAAWLRTIAQRRAIDIMRSRGRTSSREVYEPLAFENHSDPMGTPEDQANQSDCRSLLGAAVASLPARQREAVEQLALKGRSLVDAAVAIGLTPGALKVNFHRAVSNLRRQFSAGTKSAGRALFVQPIRNFKMAANDWANLEHALVKSEM
jgi:RNA polymerase sigma factor (sigma-70 family)